MLQKSVITAAFLLSTAVQAQNEHPGYAALLLQNDSLKLEAGQGSETLKPKSAGIALGYEFADYFAIEGRALKAVGADSLESVAIRVASQFQLLARAHYPVHEQIRIFASLGYARTNYAATLEIDDYVTTARFASTGASYGVGAEYLITPQWKVGLEHQWLPDDDLNDGLEDTAAEIKAKALTLKVTYAF